MAGKFVIAIALFVLLFGCVIPGGSTAQPETGNSETGGTGSGMQDTGTGELETGNPDTGAAQVTGKTDVLMLGRSVSENWAIYMGLQWQEDGSYTGTYQGNTIRYFHLMEPPEIVESVRTALDTYDADVVFFKLCFVDFGPEQGDLLADDKAYVQGVYNEVVTKKNKKLIIGNALPQVSQYTTEGMKYNHRDYNAWLANFAATHPDVYVIDLYGMVSTPSGALDARYEMSQDDSHLNDAAYAEITPEFMRLVSEAK